MIGVSIIAAVIGNTIISVSITITIMAITTSEILFEHYSLYSCTRSPLFPLLHQVLAHGGVGFLRSWPHYVRS